MRTRHKVAIGCLCAPLVLIALIFALFIFASTPTTMRMPPSEEWQSTWIFPSVPVDATNLVFVGGICAREPMMVYELHGHLPDLKEFKKEGDSCERTIRRFKMAADQFEFPFDVSNDSEVFSKFVETENDAGLLYVVRGPIRTYVIYTRM